MGPYGQGDMRIFRHVGLMNSKNFQENKWFTLPVRSKERWLLV